MEKKALALIITVSVVLRIGAAFYFGNQVVNLPGTNDQISYNSLAMRVLGGHGFTFAEPWWPLTQANMPTAHWSFLYTFYLGGVYILFGPNPIAARLIQAIIVGIFHPLLAYLLAKKVFNPVIGLVSAAITAIYIYFIYYSATLMTEPFYITLILASLYLGVKISQNKTILNKAHSPASEILSYGLFGFVIGLTVLLRQLFLLFVPFLFAWIGLVKWKQERWTVIPKLILSGVVLVAIILPFTYFNHIRFGKFVLLNTNAGFAFYWANHPIYGTHFEPILPPEMGTYLDLIPKELRNMDEAALDQALLRRGLQFILDDPARYFQLSLSRIPAYFMFWPLPESSLISNISRVGSFGLFLPFMLYGLLITLLGKSPINKLRLDMPVILLILFVVVYSIIHILSWTLVRYRLPVDAVLVIFAAVGLVDLFKRFHLEKIIYKMRNIVAC